MIINSQPIPHIERGIITIDSAGSGETTRNITFSSPFLSTPIIIFGHNAQANQFASCVPTARNKTTSGFQLYLWNNSGASGRLEIGWMAIDP